MKTKSIILCALLGVSLSGILSSCEKMFDMNSTITMAEGDREWNPSDTVYSVMGILGKMQYVADRSVLFGELRGDLVSLSNDASSFLKDIASFNVAAPTGERAENPYNVPNDYYAIINNCNYYLEHADTALKVNDKDVFLREYGVVLGYRAWAYLQLAQIYGKVPFIKTSVIDGATADVSNYPMMDIRQIAAELIPEMEKFVYVEHPIWGTVGDNFNSNNIFLPNQVILADLYLWAGGSRNNYLRAAQLLHNYLIGMSREYGVIYTNDIKTVGTGRVWWNTADFLAYKDEGYASTISFNPQNTQMITYIPMHKNEYDGVTSDLENIFSSTDKNKNKSVAGMSEALKDICASYTFCSTKYNVAQVKVDTTYLDPREKSAKMEKGDLRLNYIMQSSKETVERQNQGYGASIQKNLKINPEMIGIYRTDLLYLRLAEAYNRAGLHEMAFAILKYGLSAKTEKYISEDELEIAYMNDLDYWFLLGDSYFKMLAYNPNNGEFQPNPNTFGIHSRGCGFSEYNDKYEIAHIDTAKVNSFDNEEDALNYIDSVKNVQMIQVEDYIIDELAMETCFEGNRFGDLIRFSMHRGDDKGVYSDNDFLAKRVAKRDDGLYTKLLGNGIDYNDAWYIPLNR